MVQGYSPLCLWRSQQEELEAADPVVATVEKEMDACVQFTISFL